MKHMAMLLAAALMLLPACGSQIQQETTESSAASFGVEEVSAESVASKTSEIPITDAEPALQESTQEAPAPEPLPKADAASEVTAEPAESSALEGEETEDLYIEVGDRRFPVTLANNATAAAFRDLLPVTWEMEEHRGNEKFIYLDSRLPADAETVGHIETGDIMLYGDTCVVLFYDSFSTSYGYTRIGWVDDPEGLAEAVGLEDVTVEFRLA